MMANHNSSGFIRVIVVNMGFNHCYSDRYSVGYYIETSPFTVVTQQETKESPWDSCRSKMASIDLQTAMVSAPHIIRCLEGEG